MLVDVKRNEIESACPLHFGEILNKRAVPRHLSSSLVSVLFLVLEYTSLFLEGIKHQPARLVARITAGMHDNRIELGEDLEVDLVEFDTGSNVPDVIECHLGKLASPGHSDADTYISVKTGLITEPTELSPD